MTRSDGWGFDMKSFTANSMLNRPKGAGNARVTVETIPEVTSCLKLRVSEFRHKGQSMGKSTVINLSVPQARCLAGFILDRVKEETSQ